MISIFDFFIRIIYYIAVSYTHLEYEELTRGYFVLLYNMIINYGIPEKIKADNRNSFSNNKNQVDTTQFGIICLSLIHI